MSEDVSPDTLPEEIQWQTLDLGLPDRTAPFPFDAWNLPGYSRGDQVVNVLMQIETVAWQDDDDIPEWTEYGDPQPVQRELTMASVAVLKTNTDDDIVTTKSNTRTRVRFLWRVPAFGPGQWRFVHLIWRYHDQSFDDDGLIGDGSDTGGTSEAQWEGEVPAGYDEEDNTTWPGTPQFDSGVPTPPSVPDPDPGLSAGGGTNRTLRFVWPRSTMPFPTGLDGTTPEAIYAPGAIPGDGYAYFQEPYRVKLKGGGEGWATLRVI